MPEPLPAPLAPAPSRGETVPMAASAKLASEVVGRALSFLVVYVAQRRLGPVGFGHVAYAQAAGQILGQVTDLGLQLTTTRALVLDAKRVAPIVGAALRVRLTFIAPAVLLLALLAWGRPLEVRWAVLAVSVSVVLQGLVEFIGYCLRGQFRVADDALLLFGMRVLTSALGIVAVEAGLGVVGLGFAWLASAVAAAAAGWWWQRRLIGRHRAPPWSASWQLLRAAIPLGAAILFSIAYVRTPAVLLDRVAGPAAVGYFATAQKLTEPLGLIPSAVLAAVFPTLVGRLRSRDPRARSLLFSAMSSLMAVAVGLAAAGSLGGGWLLRLLYGQQYAEAGPAFALLSVALVPMFANHVLTHALIALEHEHWLLGINVMVFVVNLGLCGLWLGRSGPAGAAAAILCSEGVLLASVSVAVAMAWKRHHARSDSP
ncbi:MAG: oligosaccharide flippase family protein [Vicinamibacterales bacterium]